MRKITAILRIRLASCYVRVSTQHIKFVFLFQHPYIMPIVTGNFYSKGALVIRSCCTKGSLREWIYRKVAFDSFLDKCQYRDERMIIPSVEVSTISIQVLNALNYLHKKNIPYGQFTYFEIIILLSNESKKQSFLFAQEICTLVIFSSKTTSPRYRK